MKTTIRAISVVVLGFVLGAGSGFVWAKGVVPKTEPTWKNMSVSVHRAHPTFTWTAGGNRKGHPYYHETAWIRVTFLDAEWTFFLDEKDLKQLISYVKAGVCPDICDNAGNPIYPKRAR